MLPALFFWKNRPEIEKKKQFSLVVKIRILEGMLNNELRVQSSSSALSYNKIHNLNDRTTSLR